MRYALLVSYDGTDYGGWQIQKNSVTVQQKMEEAAFDLFGVKTAVVASGRTDSGVHARGQVCHLDAQTSIPAAKLASAFNMRLPGDISVISSVAAPENFDANRSAKKKTYCYRFYLSSCRHPLKDRYSVWVKGFADLEKLREISGIFVGDHNFKAYSKSRSSAKTFQRTIFLSEVKIAESGFSTDVEIYLTGNGFLYNMVRTIAGTMLDFARGAADRARIQKSLETGDRRLVGKTMPACGLTLENVDYGFTLFNKI